MATLYRTDGTTEEVEPSNGKDFKLDQLYALVDCQMVEVVYFSRDPSKIMVIDEEGKLTSKAHNEAATKIFKEEARLPGDYIAGNALVCRKSELK